VTAALDDTVGVWDAAHGARTAVIPVATADARRTALNPAGTRLAAAFEDRTIRTWDLTTPTPVERVLVGHARPITALVYFPDGRWLASADDAGQVIVWDPAGQPIAQWDAIENGSATTLSVSPDGALMAIGGGDGVVRLVDAVDGKSRGELFGHGGGVAATTFTDAGRKLVAVGALGGKVTVWDVATKVESASIDPAGSVVVALAASSDGRRIAYATTDRDLNVVELPEGNTIAEYRGHADRIEALYFSPAGDRLISASADGTAKVWDVPGHKLTQVVPGDDLKTLVVSFSPDGRTLAAAGCDGTIRLSDVATEQELRRLTGHQGYVRAVRFTPDGKRLLSCAEDSTVRLWNVADGELIRTWEHPRWVVDIGIVGDDQYVSIAVDGTIRRFQLDGEQPIAETATGIETTLATMPSTGPADDYFLATAAEVVRFSTAKNQVTRRFAGEDRGVTALAVHGRLLAVGDEGGTITVWNIDSGERLQVLRGHSRGVYGLTFSPDGRILASASGGSWVQLAGETKLWDVASGQVHATLDGVTAPLALDREGRQLAVSSDAQRQILVWTAAPYGGDTRPNP
jgi:WD40 repeat protein